MPGQSPINLERYGHIAEAIKRHLERNHLSMSEFARSLIGTNPSKETNSSTPNYWVNARGAPSMIFRSQVARILGVPESFLLARDDPEFNEKGGPVRITQSDRMTMRMHKQRQHKHEPKDMGPARQALMLSPAPPPLPPLPPRAADVFSIVGQSDGRIRVKVDVSLPAAQGMALGRYLMDFGLIMGEEKQTDG